MPDHEMKIWLEAVSTGIAQIGDRSEQVWVSVLEQINFIDIRCGPAGIEVAAANPVDQRLSHEALHLETGGCQLIADIPAEAPEN